jgi:hypothetical protein
MIVWVKRKVVEEVNSRVPLDQRKSSWQWSMQGRSVVWKLHRSLVPKSNLEIFSMLALVMLILAMVSVVTALGKMGY